MDLLTFLMLLQVAYQQPSLLVRLFFSRGYSTAEAVGLRGAALGAGRLAASCPIAGKGQRSFFVKITFFNTTFFILILFCFV
jgi:hypothetical protein